MPDHFLADVEEGGARICLQRRRLLGSQNIPISEWPSADTSLAPQLARLNRLIHEGRAHLSNDGGSILLPHVEAAQLTTSAAEAIGLPPITSASLALEARGRVDQAQTVITTKWRDSDFNQIRPNRSGAFINYGGGQWRLTESVFRLLEAVDTFNKSQGEDPMARIQAWGPVQSALQAATGQLIDADNYLKSLTIFQAGAFSLDVTQSADGPTFVPVLMAREKRQMDLDETPAPEGSDSGAVGDLRDEVSDALLPPDLQDTFAKSRFVSDRDVAPAYVLGRGQFVVLDPSLRRALQVVQGQRQMSADARRDFIKNPRALIAATLQEDDFAAALFVETTQYSDRVTGLKLWDPPELPWLARFKTAWLPEGVPIVIDGEELLLSELPEALAEKVSQAKAAGQELLQLSGREIQVSALEAALEAFQARDPDATSGDNLGEGKGGDITQRNVLDIEDNLEAVGFTVDMTPRVAVAAADIGLGVRVHSTPKSHQVEGFQWLVDSWIAGWPGVLLADDMGLGKTYQTLAFLAWRRAARSNVAKPAAPILIVAPTALLMTWIEEADRHLMPGVLGDCVEAFGAGLRELKTPMGRGWTADDALDVSRMRSAGWVLTTYETLATYHRAFARIGYSIAVFDEMQRVKSPTTLNTHAAKTMSAEFVLGLTGTPVENRLEDLWCIMDRITPGLLGDLRNFNSRYGDATEGQLIELKSKLQEHPSAPPVMLRRMKEDILDSLPPKNITTYEAPMPDRQANAYAQAVGAAQSLGGGRAVMLQAIHRLRGISLHPSLDAEVEFGQKDAFDAWSKGSARVQLSLDLLDEIHRQGEKALLFLEYKAAQRTMAAGLVQRYGLPIEPMIINGDVAGAKRQPMVADFQSRPPGFDVMILSPRAAGVGLTITAANHVIHLSRWWNPAVEDQCNDRVYRIGQEKPVTVHVPLAVHPSYQDRSFDLRLHDLLVRKRALSHSLLAPPESASDVADLFADVTG